MLLVHIVQWFAHFRGGSYRIPGPPLWLIVAFFVAALLVAGCVSYAITACAEPLAVVLVAAWMASALVVAIFPFGAQWSRGKLEVTVLDVGQGDSLFVVFPGGKTMLIDGGGAFGGFPGREERWH